MTSEFRQHAYALLERILEDRPDADALLIVVDGGVKGIDALSIPNALSCKEGMIAGIYATVYATEVEE